MNNITNLILQRENLINGYHESGDELFVTARLHLLYFALFTAIHIRRKNPHARIMLNIASLELELPT